MIVLWILLTVISGVFVLAQESSSTIDTLPFLPDNVLATGYSGLQLTTQVEQSNMYAECVGKYGNNFQLSIFSFNTTCGNQTGAIENVGNLSLTCVNNSNHLITSLVVHSPIVSSVFIRMQCKEPGGVFENISSINLIVTNCSTFSPLVVNSPSANYNSSGTFSCANDGTLFYSNGTQLTSTQTTCLATAEWSGQNGLECWRAPSDVNIIGNLTVLEGLNVNLTCGYTEGVPVTTIVSFNVNNEEIQVEGQQYVATLNRNDDKKPVYCQANNRFTEIFPENSTDGRSPTYRFNVLYAPFRNSSNVCSFSSETQQENMKCEVVFYSNPNATFVAAHDATSGNEVESSSNEIIIDGTSGKHTYSFTGIEITNISSSTNYALNVSSPVPPNNLNVDDIPQGRVFYHSIPFTVNINIPTTTTVTILSTPDRLFIVVVVLAVVVVTALIVLGIVCWRRRIKQSSSSSSEGQTTGRAVESSASSNEQQRAMRIDDPDYLSLDDPNESKPATGRAVESSTSSNVQQRAMRRDDPDYLSLDDPNESKPAYEQIGGYENVNMKPSTSNQQVDEVEYVTSSTTPYINLNLTKQQVDEVEYVNASTTPYINLNLAKQQVDEVEYASTTPYINLNLAKNPSTSSGYQNVNTVKNQSNTETSSPSKSEGENETMNPQVVTKE